jgi:hypothetical protein
VTLATLEALGCRFNAAAGKSPRRLIWGSLLGVFAIPLVIVGFRSP